MSMSQSVQISALATAGGEGRKGKALVNHPGAAYRRTREALGLRLEDIAVRTGYSCRQIARYETMADWSRIPYGTVIALTSIVDIDPDALITRSAAA